MALTPLSRRAFLAAISALGAGSLIGCGCGGDDGGRRLGSTAFRLSTRGVKGASKASKANAANKLFVSAAAADAGRAHPGDHAKIVEVDIGQARWQAYFGGGRSEIDLRAL